MAPQRFRTPVELHRAVGSRARQQSKVTHVDSGEIQRHWYLVRLLARVFTHDPAGWLLKGGLALLVRYPQARHSRDLDLLHRSTDADLDEAVDALLAASHLQLDDWVHFEHFDTRSDYQGRPTRSVRFIPYVGTKKGADPITVDLIANMEPLGDPLARALPPLLDIDLGSVDLRLVSLEDHLADKTCAMYERHQGGTLPSSRIKDLIDLVLIVARDTVNGHLLQQAISKELLRRQAHGTHISLPSQFEIPDPDSWGKGYREQARDVAGLEQLRTLDAAAELASNFLTPVLRNDPVETWDPARRSWHHRGNGA